MKLINIFLAIITVIPLICLYLIIIFPIFALSLFGLDKITDILLIPAFWWIDLVID